MGTRGSQRAMGGRCANTTEGHRKHTDTDDRLLCHHRMPRLEYIWHEHEPLGHHWFAYGRESGMGLTSSLGLHSWSTCTTRSWRRSGRRRQQGRSVPRTSHLVQPLRDGVGGLKKRERKSKGRGREGTS